jgi:GNAT superfamily N-acetyltransferase
MRFGFLLGLPGAAVPLPFAHAELVLRLAGRAEAPAILAHYRRLPAADLNRRFCGALGDAALSRHVAGLAAGSGFVLTAHDRRLAPLAGPVRAVAEVATAGGEAEIALSVETGLRRRGIGTCLIESAARLLALRGLWRLRAHTLPDNGAFIALAASSGARIEIGTGEVEATFDVAALHRAYLGRLLRLAPEAAAPPRAPYIGRA